MGILSIVQDGNRISLRLAGIEIWIEVEGIDLPPLNDHSFALWMALPLAMQKRIPLHVQGPVDHVVVENARRAARVWEMWTPEYFRTIDISAAEESEPVTRTTQSRLFLFSGGVDSSYMLLQPIVVTPGSYALTLLGLDYRPDNRAAFDRLMEKTDPLIERLGLRRLVVTTNFGETVRNLGLTHGFCLAGAGFLFRDLFASCHLAHDYTPEQAFLAFPWGTNFLTNEYFEGRDYKIHSMNGEISRTEKLGFLNNDSAACQSISFCGSRKDRPDNCGRCDKCIRTKAMFLVQAGTFPPIFKCNKFDRCHTAAIDLSSRKEMAFCSELITWAREHGVEDRLLDLPARYERAVDALHGTGSKRTSALLGKVRKKWIWAFG